MPLTRYGWPRRRKRTQVLLIKKCWCTIRFQPSITRARPWFCSVSYARPTHPGACTQDVNRSQPTCTCLKCAYAYADQHQGIDEGALCVTVTHHLPRHQSCNQHVDRGERDQPTRHNAHAVPLVDSVVSSHTNGGCHRKRRISIKSRDGANYDARANANRL